jgi:hypothetical protein
MSKLYTSLQSASLHEMNKAPHLKQLFLRLNFNDFMVGGLAKRYLPPMTSVGGQTWAARGPPTAGGTMAPLRPAAAAEF